MQRTRAKFVTRLLVSLGIVLATTQVAMADRTPYAGVVDLEARGNAAVFRHHHDWAAALRTSPIRFSLLEPFGMGNTYSYVAAHSAEDGRLLWQVPSPPLTWMGLTGDGQYIIGLSSIKVMNLTQVVVFAANGKVIARRNITTTCLPAAKRQAEIAKQPEAQRRAFAAFHAPECLANVDAFGETVTNFISWYSARDPAARLVQQAGEVIGIDLKDPKERDFRVPLDLWQPTD